MADIPLRAELSVFLFYVFVQLGAAFLLLQSRSDHPRLALRVLGVLFAFNAGVALLLFLEALAPVSSGIVELRRALDDPTAFFLFAFFAARRAGAVRQRIGAALFGAGILHATVLLFLPPDAALPGPIAWLFLVIPATGFFAGLALVSFVLAGGARWERWVALAFLSRLLYFGTRSWWGVAEGGDQEATFWLLCLRPGTDCTLATPDALSWFSLFLFMFVALAAGVRVLSGRDGIPVPVGLPLLLASPLIVALEEAPESALPQFLNLLTLGFIRPILVAIAFEAARVRDLVLRASGASALSLLAFLLLAVVGFGPHAAALSGLVMGLLLFGFQEYQRPVLSGHDIRPTTDDEAAPPPSRDTGRSATSDPERAHWERILLALRGSGRASPDPGVTDWDWTQQGLAERTGCGVRRVSEFPDDMADNAEHRLDRHLPGWRNLTHGAVPRLVESRRAVVRGGRGVRVAYRLTEWGERLADAVAVPSASRSEPVLTRQETKPDADSARNPRNEDASG